MRAVESGNHRVGQRGDDAQGFGGGIENGCQTRAAFLVLLFGQRPGLVLDDVLVDRADQAPGALQRARKLEGVKGFAEIGDGLGSQLRDRLIAGGARAAADG